MITRDQANAAIASLNTARTCDGCVLCCTALGVYSLKKPDGVRCQHLCGEPGKSCSIYANRPEECYGFICVWRAFDRVLPDYAKPSAIGFVIALGDTDAFPPLLRIHPDPDRRDAWQAHIPLLKRLAAKFNCIVAIGQGAHATHTISPKGNVYSAAVFPAIFQNNGLKAGVPDADFLPNRRTWHQMPPELFG